LAPWRGRDAGRFARRVILLVVAWVVGAAAQASGELRFERHSEPLTELSTAAMEAAVPPATVRVFDPYEEREIAFEAIPFAAILDTVYTPSWRDEEEVLFTCRDGYQPTIPVERVVDHAAWLAFGRRDQASFSLAKRESGELRRVDLAPYYLVWENLEDSSVRYDGDYGWPYQLVAVDLIRVATRFPRMVPPAGASAEAKAGFTAFRTHCSRCHAINGEGGTVGPELNVPVNPVEVRDREWLRRWIDDPAAILPTARMPRLNPALPDRERIVSEVIAYLDAMSRDKRPPAGKSVE